MRFQLQQQIHNYLTLMFQENLVQNKRLLFKSFIYKLNFNILVLYTEYFQHIAL